MRFLPDSDQQWETLRVELRGAHQRAPDSESVTATLTRLDSMMGRAFESFDSLDKKASGVLAGVAAVSAFLAGNLNLANSAVAILGA
ncbi:MAG: hypothetical protein H0U13_08605 [Gemmatimonadaceae bacterium]|nr:hypothetical protein [Gemmatimonadaceae bacterium]